MSDRVCVVIPCYNHGHFLQEAIDSVLASSSLPDRIVIVNDGSHDPHTLEVLEGLSHPLITVLHQENAGLAAARNRAIAACDEALILPLDADDRIGPDYIAQARQQFQKDPAAVIVYCHGELFGSRQGPIVAPAYHPMTMRFSNLIFACAMFRREAWLSVGGYCSAFTYGCEDWDFWIALLVQGGHPVRLAQTGFFYRITPHSMNQAMDRQRRMAMHRLIIKRHPSFFPAGFALLLPLYYRLLGSLPHRLMRALRGRS